MYYSRCLGNITFMFSFLCSCTLWNSYNKIQIFICFDGTLRSAGTSSCAESKNKRESCLLHRLCIFCRFDNWRRIKIKIPHSRALRLVKMQECRRKSSHTVPFGKSLCFSLPSLRSRLIAGQYTFIFMSKNYKARFFSRKSSQSTTTTSDFRFQ